MLPMSHSQSGTVNPNTITKHASTGRSEFDNVQSLSRPLDATSPSIIGLGNEINTLAPEQPLDLQAVLHVLERAARLWPGHVYVLDTHILDVLRAFGENNDVFDETRRQIASIPINGVILVPLCIAQHHYLFILKKCLFQGALVCQAFVYDSILLRRVDNQGNFDPSFWAFLAENLAFLHRSLFSFCASMQTLYIDLMMCPQQPNDYDCGVAVCLNALDFIAHRGVLSLPMAARAYCVAPSFDIIRESMVFSQQGQPESIVNKLGSLYWSAARRFVFQLCGRAIDRAHANQQALIAAREDVSAQLDALIRSEQAAMQADVPSRSASSPCALLLDRDRAMASWQLECWMHSKMALLYLMSKLQQVASSMGTPTSRPEDVCTFTNALTVNIHPMHEAQRQRIAELARASAWHDPELVQELIADVGSAKWALEEVRLPEERETPELSGARSEITV